MLTKLELGLALLAVVLVAFLGWLYYHDHKLIAAHDARLEATSASLKAEAEQKILTLTAQHTAEVQANQERTDAALKAYSALSSDLDSRVRAYEAYRRSHPDVAGSSCGPPATGSGSSGPSSLGDSALQLAERGNDLYRSNGELSASLQSCQRDRDSLTGLPR